MRIIPNVITVIRIIFAVLAILLLMILCYSKNLGIPAHQLPFIHLFIIILVSVAAISDAVDGKIARKYNCISNFGKKWDPMADKILTLAYIPLVMLGMIHFIPVALLFARDAHVTRLRNKINQPFPARTSGKWKTIISFPLLCVLIAIIPVEGNYFLALLGSTHLGLVADFFRKYQKGISLIGGLALAGFSLWSWIDYRASITKIKPRQRVFGGSSTN